jgi:hypothetical protein
VIAVRVSLPLMGLLLIWFSLTAFSGDVLEYQRGTLMHVLVVMWGAILLTCAEALSGRDRKRTNGVSPMI